MKKKGEFQGFDNDPGFGPPRDQSKTDNFKVKEVPPRLHIFKFEDLDGAAERILYDDEKND